MPRCQKIRRKKRSVCIGDLDTEIAIQTRSLDDSLDGQETEIFTTVFTAFAMMETLRGVFVVDQVSGGDIEATHAWTIRFPDEVVTGENWILVNSKRFRILDQENLEERNDWLKLLCTSRGSVDREAASA